MTDFCCVLASLDLFSSYHEIPALLCCFWSVSDLLWRPHSLQSFYFLGITSPCSASHYHCPASRAVGLFWASWWCKLLSLVLFVSSRTCQFLIGHPSHPTREVYLSAAFSMLLLSKHLFSFLHQAFLLAYTTIWFLLRCSEVPLLFSQFLHNSALWLSYKFLLQGPVLLCYKRKTYWGLKKAQQESDMNLLLLWEKKYVFVICLCFPCLYAWLYLFCLPVTFRAHIQVSCVRGCIIFLWKSLVLGNAEPAAEGVWLKVFVVLLSCYFWRVLWFHCLSLHCKMKSDFIYSCG